MREKVLYQHRKQHITDEEYDREMERIVVESSKAKGADIITQFKVLDGAEKIVEKLTAEIDGLLAEDVDRGQLAERLHQTKRAVLQDYIDPERGIRVEDLDDVEINLFVSRLDLFYNFRNEE